MTQTEQIQTKKEYMKILSQKLRRLPKEDFDRAMEYFEEYFAEAGPEHEQQAIKDLGSPEEAANALILDLAAQNAKQPPKTVRRGLSAVWIAILAVFAAPVAIPVALALAIVVITFVFVIGLLLLCLILSAVCVTAAGIINIFGGASILFRSFGDAMCNIGIGLFATGLGILFVYGAILFFRWFIRKISVALGNMMKGGRRK